MPTPDEPTTQPPLPTCTVRRLARAEPPVDADDAAWAAAAPIDVAAYHADSSANRPRVSLRLLYGDRAVHACFRVAGERWITAQETVDGKPVYADSCVEAFLQPREGAGYFNFELNARGTLLVFYIEDPRRVPGGFAKYERIGPDELATVPRHASPAIMDRFGDPEPRDWSLTFDVPLALLERRVGPITLGPGATWRGNFYKGAERTPGPHWAAWSPVGAVRNFHLPERFGTIRFGD